jgi:hypothetical protein
MSSLAAYTTKLQAIGTIPWFTFRHPRARFQHSTDC